MGGQHARTNREPIGFKGPGVWNSRICRGIRNPRFLHRCDVPFQWIEVSPDQPDALRAYAGVLTTGQLDRDPYYLETSIPGVFAAGDVRRGSVERCASAVGEGAMAVTFVHRYVMNG